MRAFVVAIVVVCASAVTAAAVPLHQPNGAAIPSPMGCDSNHPTGLAAELACECNPSGACNIGQPCSGPGSCVVPTGSCETTLYHAFNDNTCIPSQRTGLDPWNDGALLPETFTPTCPLTFSVVSRGTARFKNTFGWYNVTGHAPTPSELYPMLGCDTPEGTQIILDVRADPRWAGGQIGFFLLTPEQHGQSGVCAGGDCCARVDRLPSVGYVYYSQRSLNPDQVGADSLIHLIIYDSAMTARKFYFAWEDTYNAANNDFTDLVTSVSGVECSGGGEACDTGMPGMCQYGVSQCHGTSVECVQVFDSAAERCNGADDDCDGMIDEGVGGECLAGDCANVTCAAGLICHQGECVDPCRDVTCAPGLACLSGTCLPGCNQCNGLVCPTGHPCDLNTGACMGGPGDPGGNGDVDGGVDESGVPGNGGCCQTGRRPVGAELGLALMVGALLLRRRRPTSRSPRA